MIGHSTKILLIRVAAAVIASVLLLVVHAVATAQQPQPPATLTLEQAVGLARQYNPEFRIQRNSQVTADWGAREAYGALLPSVSATSGMSYQAEGTPNFGGGVTGADLGLDRTPSYLTSSYGLNLNLNWSGATFFRIGEQRANRTATYARVAAADFALATEITRQYLAALRARDGVTLAEQELETANEAHRLAQARFDAGDATRLDVTQAEVDRGRAEVALLQARNQLENETTALLQRMGMDVSMQVELTSTFDIFEPRWTLDELIAEAMSAQPALAAARADESAGRAQARAARMSYLPTIQAFGRWSGFTRQTNDEGYLIGSARARAEGRVRECEFWNTVSAGLSSPLPDRPTNCGQYALTPAQEQQIIASNSVFPFDFSQQPATFGLQVSLPIVDGFTRERTVQTARIAADDARERRRSQELELRARVTSSLRALEMAYATVALEERNAAAAAEQLELARERYRLGAGSILELTQALSQKASADQRHLAALYSFHEGLAELEAAVGRPLR
jgi:outer membrane protein